MNYTYSTAARGFRPIVCLKSDTQLIKNDDGSYTIYDPPKNNNIESSDYGAEVKGYESEYSDVVGWKIFYADTENTYLIADDYIPYDNIPTNSAGHKPNKPASGTYPRAAYFDDNILSDYSGSASITDTRIKALNNDYFTKGYTSTNNNMKSVAYMLDTDAWSVYAGNNAEYAIGGPSIELFFKSYNEKYGEKYEAEAGSLGYYVGNGNELTSSFTDLNKTDDSLYVINSVNNAYGMWISSPSAASTPPNDSVMGIYSNGRVMYDYYRNGILGFRPIVCLKSDTKLVKNPDGSFTIDDTFKETSTINGEEPTAMNPTIPAGFKPVDTETSSWGDGSNAPTEENVNNGLVIEDVNGSQFVWIPVKDINEMAHCSSILEGDCNLQIQEDGTLKCTTHNSEEIVGKLYANDTGENFGIENPYYSPNSGLREPAVITGDNLGTGTSYDGNNDNLNSIGYNSTSEMLNGLKEQYSEMIKSVLKNGGFYVSRYELGLEGTSPVSKNASTDIGVTTADADNTNTYSWYGLYSKSKEYASEESNKAVVSSMIWGSQYDAMLNWMQEQGIDVKAKNDNKRNTTTVTGSNANDVINNVFDLYGCHFDWTLEAYSTYGRVIRGGTNSSNSSPSCRSTPLVTAVCSTRFTLYIK